MTEPSCSSCRFNDAALCRAHPPVATAEGDAWPIVGPKDWCGEYNPNEQRKQEHRGGLDASLVWGYDIPDPPNT